MSGSPPNFWLSKAVARLDADAGLSKPPPRSRPKTPTPSTADAARTTSPRTRTSRARVTIMWPSLSNMMVSFGRLMSDVRSVLAEVAQVRVLEAGVVLEAVGERSVHADVREPQQPESQHEWPMRIDADERE